MQSYRCATLHPAGRPVLHGLKTVVFPENEGQGGEGPVEAEVKWYNGRKGFGFVLGPDGQDVFFHASALTAAGAAEPPDSGDKLVCEIGTDRQGRSILVRAVFSEYFVLVLSVVFLIVLVPFVPVMTSQ